MLMRKQVYKRLGSALMIRPARQSRLDAPGVFLHAVIWGAVRRKIFKDDKNREDMIERLPNLLLETQNSLLCMGVHAQPCLLSISNRTFAPSCG